jgi:hypothetical protein
MFKILALTLSLSVLGSVANAQESDDSLCSFDASIVLANIEKQDSCYSAAKVARECGFGSTLDVHLAAAAGAKCTANKAKWPRAQQKMHFTLYGECRKKYENAEGTMYRSMEAHCRLDVDELFWSLNNPVD